jgi:hypothetical protein
MLGLGIIMTVRARRLVALQLATQTPADVDQEQEDQT